MSAGFVQDRATKWIAKLIVISLFFLVGSPIIFYVVRPDKEWTFHRGSSEPEVLNADVFGQRVADNMYVQVSGTIDGERSVLKTGFVDRTVVLRLSGYPQPFAIHLPEGALRERIVEAYEDRADQRSEEDNLRSLFGAQYRLADLFDSSSGLLRERHTFTGRIFAGEQSITERYERGDDLGGLTDDVHWLLADGEHPSMERLMSGPFGTFAFGCALALLVGVPVIVLWFKSRAKKAWLEMDGPIDAEIIE